ncbi:hypothetical protein ITJ44_01525 [Clavibacter sp. VKM Ac-2873]|uniref:hypothetical protein n=1 Tax=Clavibacter sp. VKM Ac-2873 TaxID=2783813 RepID=UPI00188C2015|nr:hypothetical protein [Clavibacter sp. VKM Ac-2873]MBF4616758.1 hypothetical protein [Clavibacter sp. VKM Ac-2873]
MRTRVRPHRPLASAVAATALTAVLIASGLPAHAADAGSISGTPAAAGSPAADAATGTATGAAAATPSVADPSAAQPAATPAASAAADSASPSTSAVDAALTPAPAATAGPAAAADPAESKAQAPIPAPVILAPAEGDSQVEGTTTFSGTGVAGDAIDLYVFAAGFRGDAGDGADFLQYSTVVRPDGSWSTTQRLPVGRWVVKADQSDDDGATSTPGDIGFTVAPAAPRITSPTPDARVDGRLHLAGTGAAGSRVIVDVSGRDGTRSHTTSVRADGTWSTDALVAAGTYSVTAVASHPLPYERDEQYIESARTAPVSVTVTRAAEPVRPVLLTPAEGDSQVEGSTTFSGTGEPGADMWVFVFPEGDRGSDSDAGESLSFSTRVGEDGRWSTTEVLPIGIWIMKAEQSAGDDLTDADSRPAFTVLPAAPVITAPTADARVTGRLQLAGTGTAGSTVLLTLTGGGKPRQLTAQVGADGSWSTVADVTSGSHSVSAVGSHLLPYERSARYIRSDPSSAVAFTVTGGAAVAVSHRTALPMTGFDPVPLVALTGSLLAAGLALLVIPAVRRRRAPAGPRLPR